MEKDIRITLEGAASPHSQNDVTHADSAESLASGAEATDRQHATRAACLFFNVLCGFTNGYDICVTSVVLNNIVREFALCGDDAGEAEFGEVPNCAQKQAVFSFASAGSLCAKFCLPWVADRYGRRFAMAFVDSLILSATLLQCVARSAAVLLLGRVVLGMGLGLAFIIEPLYVTEIAPPERRGQFVVMNEVAVCVGCLLGLQLAALLVDSNPEAWRTAVALGGIPAIVQLLFIFALPESPRWLAVQGDLAGLAYACRRLGVSKAEVECLQNQAARAITIAESSAQLSCHYWSGLKRFCRKQKQALDENGLSFILALCFAFFVTASGIFGLQAYARDILISSGVQHPLQLLPLIGWMKLAGALVAMVGADSVWVGRRWLAIIGGICCTICDAVLAIRQHSPETVPPGVSALVLFLFIFAWNAGFGGVQFAVTMEMLPNEVRSMWAGQIFGLIGFVEILIYQLFETLLYSDGVATFSMFAAVNACGVLFAICLLPDMRGQSLEEGTAELATPTAAGTASPDLMGKTASTKSTESAGSAGRANSATKIQTGSLVKRGRRYGALVDDLPETTGTQDGSPAGQQHSPAHVSLKLPKNSLRYGALEDDLPEPIGVKNGSPPEQSLPSGHFSIELPKRRSPEDTPDIAASVIGASAPADAI